MGDGNVQSWRPLSRQIEQRSVSGYNFERAKSTHIPDSLLAHIFNLPLLYIYPSVLYISTGTVPKQMLVRFTVLAPDLFFPPSLHLMHPDMRRSVKPTPIEDSLP
jgi:hypothetical protein